MTNHCVEGLFVPLTNGEVAKVYDSLERNGFSPDPQGVRAFLLSFPPKKPAQPLDPLVKIAIATIGKITRY